MARSSSRSIPVRLQSCLPGSFLSTGAGFQNNYANNNHTSRWQKDQFYSHYKYNKEVQEANQPSASAKPRKNEAKSFEEQAKALMEGKETWKPTWQVLGLRYDRPGLAKFSMKPQVKTAKPTESTTESSEIVGSTDNASSPSSKDA